MIKIKWKEQAACAGVDTSVFVPPVDDYVTPERRQIALSYCLACPVRKECLDYAYETKSIGIFGGMTTHDRRRNLYKWRAGEL